MNENTTGFCWCGIDISKKTFDASMEVKNRSKFRHVDNHSSKFASFLKWALSVSPAGVEVRFCMESTGDYGVELALFLLEEGYHVSVVNPARVKDYAKYKGYLNKTDKSDARLICEFATAENPSIWDMSDPDRREIFRLWRRLRQLAKMESMEENRLECPTAIGPACVASGKAMLKTLRAEIRQIQAQMSDIIERNEAFKRAGELISTIPIFSDICIYAFLAEMPPVDKFERAKDWAAVAGGQPMKKQSGTTFEASRMVKGGKKVLRSTMWMPTLLALGKMPVIRTFYDRLRAKNKSHSQALVACVHKLLMIVFGVLKRNCAYKEPEPLTT